jgi:hypothetical protein
VLNEQDQVRQHINVFVGNENIRYTGGLATSILEGAFISIVPAVSGGTSPLQEANHQSNDRLGASRMVRLCRRCKSYHCDGETRSTEERPRKAKPGTASVPREILASITTWLLMTQPAPIDSR